MEILNAIATLAMVGLFGYYLGKGKIVINRKMRKKDSEKAVADQIIHNAEMLAIQEKMKEEADKLNAERAKELQNFNDLQKELFGGDGQ